MNFKLTRNERLSGRKRIEYLYAKGNSFSQHSFRVVWLVTDQEQIFPAQVMFSAPKKKFKKAVTRNRLKRLMREGYRKNKNELYDFLNEHKLKLRLSLVFTGNADISCSETEDKIILTLQRLMKEIQSSEKS